MSGSRIDGSQYEVRESRGAPPVVRWFFLIGVLIIIYMGVISAIGARTFHVWPSQNSATIPLK